jgi:ribosomal 50S subunit-associated protein YjgA (DUF615 family)
VISNGWYIGGDGYKREVLNSFQKGSVTYVVYEVVGVMHVSKFDVERFAKKLRTKSEVVTDIEKRKLEILSLEKELLDAV